MYLYIVVYFEQNARLTPFVDDADAFPGVYIYYIRYKWYVHLHYSMKRGSRPLSMTLMRSQVNKYPTFAIHDACIHYSRKRGSRHLSTTPMHSQVHISYICYTWYMHIHYVPIYIYVYIEQEARFSPFVDDADAFPGIYIYTTFAINITCVYIIAGGAALALCRRRCFFIK